MESITRANFGWMDINHKWLLSVQEHREIPGPTVHYVVIFFNKKLSSQYQWGHNSEVKNISFWLNSCVLRHILTVRSPLPFSISMCFLHICSDIILHLGYKISHSHCVQWYRLSVYVFIDSYMDSAYCTAVLWITLVICLFMAVSLFSIVYCKVTPTSWTCHWARVQYRSLSEHIGFLAYKLSKK